MRFEEFAQACPELAQLGEERLRRYEVCLLGTLRRDGSPRISPCESDFVAGELLLGMMWRSRKAVDLLRDPRCVVHSAVPDKTGAAGDFKLYGRARDVQDAGLRAAYREAVYARIGWAPEEPRYHLFAVDVESAGFMDFGEGRRYGLAWRAGGELRRFPIAEP